MQLDILEESILPKAPNRST